VPAAASHGHLMSRLPAPNVLSPSPTSTRPSLRATVALAETTRVLKITNTDTLTEHAERIGNQITTNRLRPPSPQPGSAVEARFTGWTWT